jgi:glycosyltransferase involved in cell wall biosynthesis
MVSIVIPHFNRSLLLRYSIESVINQCFNDWEIIVVDDGSSELEFKAIQLYVLLDNRITIQPRQSANKGPSSCRNEGVASAKYNYLLFLDSDDLLKPFCLEQRVAFMQRNSQVDMAVFLIENFKITPGDTGTYFNIEMPFNQLAGSFLQNRNPWQTMAPIWKKEFFSQLGGFDENLLYMEDPDLHLRALNRVGANIDICYDQPSDCYYRNNLFDNNKCSFYYNSIYYRITFYIKIIEQNNAFVNQYKVDIKQGIYNLICIFLYSRKNEFPALYNDFVELIHIDRFFSTLERWRIQCLIETGNNNSQLLKFLKLKGICYRLLPGQ